MPYQPIPDADIDRVRLETQTRDKVEPRILSATFDPASGNLVVVFRDGQSLSSPARKLRGLGEGTDQQLADLYPEEDGAALYWGELDVQFSTIALIEDIFGIKTAHGMGVKGGTVSTPGKAAAARVNGAKGGRPRVAPKTTEVKK